ncbi:Fe(3+)-hydroxamate ABC transporter permease FhuB [Marinomonas sp. 15G1-11]|uniref:Fe(3+)-hydroxamate ABC transporter permease FhuB n=1 Tax=Marinomonas phaeophyticola TaxID=3004091 RepID=A0ABT4JVN6_9GAMM|nr:Fe(3+)-hydroxamate ABC transporter permease FhuB [Marinomonas sp. 15G1-11]MCZ2721848.1 Fe(3+)-hydroxamate ABC transporter permease FhuB [Marinomonas sp. 15G1-11]
MIRAFLLVNAFLFTAVCYLQIDSSLSISTQLSIISGQEAQGFDEIDWGFSRLPRLVMALLVGSVMGCIGSVIQQLTLNPLLSPVTLGTSSGAWLGLIVLAIFWPQGQTEFQVFAAMSGAALALGFVLLISGVRNLSGLSLILSGMAVNLLFGAITTALILLNDQYARNLFIWGAGDLSQNGWDKVQWFWPHCLLLLTILAFAGKPLTLLRLGQAAAAARGLNVVWLFVTLIISGLWILSSAITMVGIIGFIGLVAPNAARFLGARTATSELIVSTLLGASLLMIADGMALFANTLTFDLVPTGLTTALIGAPLLIILIRHRGNKKPQSQHAFMALQGSRTLSIRTIILMTGALLSVIFLGVFTHIDNNIYQFHLPNEFAWPLRWPRLAASLFAGAGMAVAGVMLQRLIHNPLASPDLLGLSAGAVLALILVSLLLGIRVSELGPLVAFVGSMSILGTLLLLGKRFHFAPTSLILTGVALTALIETLIQGVLMTGTDDVYDILRWLSGSTYRVTPNQAISLIVGVTLFIVVAVGLQRWLTLLSIGRITAAARGVSVQKSFIILLMISAGLCAFITALVGPIAFVSIVAPHLAGLLGAKKVVPQLFFSALIGATLLQLSDWLGQIIIYPNQLAAGTVVAIIGGSYFILILLKNRNSV